MNKKFSTLVACAMLATSVGGAYAAKIPTAILTSTVTPTALTGVTAAGNASGGYQVGVSYLLGESATAFLTVTTDGKLVMTTAAPGTLAGANNALWTLQSIIAPEGALAPKYVFVNKTTGTLLAMDKSSATAFGSDGTSITDPSKVNSKMAGGQAEWLSAASYKEPQTAASAIYAAIPGDSVIALAKVNSGTAVYLAKMKATELSEVNVVKIKPYKYSSGSEFLLSANDLNTMLGTAGAEAKDNSYFNLAFNPVATMQGLDNLFAQDLQAVAVDQYEKQYGSDETVVDNNAYASFYPLTESSSSNFKARNEADNISFKQTSALWLTLKNRDNEYLVADTAFVDGTQQDANKRITFKMTGLYNAKNDTRFRNPESYLFAFYYNPSTGTVRVQVKDFLNKKHVTRFATDFNESTFYAGPTVATTDDYSVAPVKRGSTWYSDGVAAPGGNLASTSTSATPINNNYIIKAALGSVTEVTLGELTAADGTSNEFNIKVGSSKMYQAIYMPSNAYLLKIVASKDANRVGKYWINNLKGGFEVMEQAIRQNFQEMPAAQWIVKSAGTTAGSPVTIINREFAQAPSSSLVSSGTLYGVVGASDQAFFMGGDTLQFIPVTKANDKYLGYKYVAKDTITESIFTFNYLHDLAMDKPINTKNDVDSVVWVDKDGQSTKFILESVLDADDTYGTNGGLTNVAQLIRRVYKVKVNDATKLQNDKRYLRYDDVQKKYVVSAKDASLADVFFLKENNEVDGGNCYYTLVKAVLVKAGTLENTVVDNQVTVLKSVTAEKISTYVRDFDLYGWYELTDGKVKNTSGVWVDGSVPVIRLIEPESPWLASDYIPVTEAQLLEIWNISTLPTGYTKKSSKAFNGVTYAEYVIDASSNVVCVSRLLLGYSSYANYKVSVDNNTLDLVNGVLNNQSSQEVATSSFAVVKDANPLYRRFNQIAEGIASDAPDTIKFYRVNSTAKEYLYEDANSVYSKDKGFNFLGIEGKGDNKLASMYVDTAYVARGTSMPQYLIALAPSIVKDSQELCPVCEGKDPNCDHNKYTRGYVDGRYLVNLQDSIDVNAGALKAKYQWNGQYSRLGFVEARHKGDSLIIKNSIYTGNNKPMVIGKAKTWASNDTINLNNNKHKNAVFSFRFVKTGSNDFLIESETEKDGQNVKNSALDAVKIAPMYGGWVKIQNGVPVIANNISYKEAGLDAEIFNVEATTEAPTTNEGINANAVSVIADFGKVIIKNAEGKSVAISNILGQSIANTVISSDYATITVPAGIVIVSVEGEEAVKAIVK